MLSNSNLILDLYLENDLLCVAHLGLTLWDLNCEKKLFESKLEATKCHVLDSLIYCGTNYGEIGVFDKRTNEMVFLFGSGAPIIALKPGDQIQAVDQDGTIIYFDKMQRFSRVEQDIKLVSCAEFTDLGVAIGTHEGDVYVNNVRQRLHSDTVTCLSYNGVLLSASLDCSVYAVERIKYSHQIYAACWANERIATLDQTGYFNLTKEQLTSDFLGPIKIKNNLVAIGSTLGSVKMLFI